MPSLSGLRILSWALVLNVVSASSITRFVSDGGPLSVEADVAVGQPSLISPTDEEFVLLSSRRLPYLSETAGTTESCSTKTASGHNSDHTRDVACAATFCPQGPSDCLIKRKSRFKRVVSNIVQSTPPLDLRERSFIPDGVLIPFILGVSFGGLIVFLLALLAYLCVACKRHSNVSEELAWSKPRIPQLKPSTSQSTVVGSLKVSRGTFDASKDPIARPSRSRATERASRQFLNIGSHEKLFPSMLPRSMSVIGDDMRGHAV